MAETAVLSTGSAAPPSRQRRNWVPYALLLPGLLWLVVFFVLPMVTLGSQSLQEGNVDDGYVFTANFGIYVDALAYDRAYYRGVGRALQSRLDRARRAVLHSAAGELVTVTGVRMSRMTGIVSGLFGAAELIVIVPL